MGNRKAFGKALFQQGLIMAKAKEPWLNGWMGFYGVTEDGRVISWSRPCHNYTGEEWAEKVRLERNAKRRAKYAAEKAARKPVRKHKNRRKAA